MTRKKFKGNKSNAKIECEKCGRIVRSRYVVKFKGKLLCSNCVPRVHYRPRVSLEKALNKIYEVKGYLNNKNQKIAKIHIPPILSGKKVKLVLIE